MYNILNKKNIYIFCDLVNKNLNVEGSKLAGLNGSFLPTNNIFILNNYNFIKLNIYNKFVNYKFLYDFSLISK